VARLSTCMLTPVLLWQAGEALTALRFDDSGLHVAVGTSNGLVALFDLRARRPTVVKDHMYGARIVDIEFHTGGGDGFTGVPGCDHRLCRGTGVGPFLHCWQSAWQSAGVAGNVDMSADGAGRWTKVHGRV
jgi:hypothetical protein